jgi:hypothetical protein
MFLGEISLPSQGITGGQEEGKVLLQDPLDEYDYLPMMRLNQV